tara:strand:- start:1368 stop:1730 length:363 start_codon:yes stop_codon:yes gene_type:complete
LPESKNKASKLTKEYGKLSVEEKALRINLDPRKKGTFEETGAGQKVVQNFFQAGRAAGIVAKTQFMQRKDVDDFQVEVFIELTLDNLMSVGDWFPTILNTSSFSPTFAVMSVTQSVWLWD